MKLVEEIRGTPIATQRSVRGDKLRALTSCDPGKVVPLGYTWLNREDEVRRGQIEVSIEMDQTVKPLVNGVNARIYAHLVPHSAMERFMGGMDTFNRSYRGVEEPSTSAVIPFFKQMKFDRDAPFWKVTGTQWPQDADINDAPVEAYNTLVNWRRRARSTKITERSLLDTTLAEAFWSSPILYDIVPDYEAALLDGEVPLTFNSDRAPVVGVERFGSRTSGSVALGGVTSDGDLTFSSDNVRVQDRGSTKSGISVFNEVYAELSDAGITLSLSNIELAKQTVAFARLRQEYAGLSDDHLIDLLMQGIRIPPESLKQPVLLGRQEVSLSYVERHATDGDNLDVSRTIGVGQANMTIRVPPLNTGGIILITCEITPEPIFERLQDNFLAVKDPADLPDFLRDFLDPQKVGVVKNSYVDVLYSAGSRDNTFGYRGLNREWDRDYTRIGGKYYRQPSDPFIEDRQRFWAVETIDPVLTEDFYLVKNLSKSVFADQQAEPFEVLARMQLDVVGNTVFGKHLQEDTGDYQAIIDYVADDE